MLKRPSKGRATFSSNCLQATYAQTYAQRPKMKSISLGRRSPLTRNRFVLPLYAYILRCLIDLCCYTCTNCDVWSTFAAIRIHIAMPDWCLPLYACALRCLINLWRPARCFHMLVPFSAALRGVSTCWLHFLLPCAVFSHAGFTFIGKTKWNRRKNHACRGETT